MSEAKMLYITDPMCSWCWGFVPVMRRIREDYSERIDIELVVGGLRPGTQEPFSPKMRDFVLHHWHEVQKMSGQPFNFEFAMDDDFVYDTEPADRALVTVRRIAPKKVFDYAEAVQRAFYTENLNVTRPTVLAGIAELLGVSAEAFAQRYNAAETKQATWADFARAREYGVAGFPSIVLEDSRGPALLTYGYTPFDDLRPRLDQWLDASDAANA